MKRPNQKATLVELTPAMAKKLLAKNKNYRDLKPDKAAQLTRIFKAGFYRCDGSPIRIDAEGYTIDAQHRLHAIINAGITVWIWIIEGIESDTTIDTMSTPRKLVDHLKHMKEKSAHTLGAVINTLILLERDIASTTPAAPVYARPCVQECLDYLAANPRIRDSVRVCAHNSYGRGAMVAALHYLAAKQNRNVADQFIEELRTTLGKNHNDPIHQFQARMDRNKSSQAKLSMTDIDALLIKAWNLWLKGASCQSLRYRASGPYAEAFPKILLPNDVKEELDLLGFTEQDDEEDNKDDFSEDDFFDVKPKSR
jgi:hypothetical protein